MTSSPENLEDFVPADNRAPLPLLDRPDHCNIFHGFFDQVTEEITPLFEHLYDGRLEQFFHPVLIQRRSCHGTTIAGSHGVHPPSAPPKHPAP